MEFSLERFLAIVLLYHPYLSLTRSIKVNVAIRWNIRLRGVSHFSHREQSEGNTRECVKIAAHEE